MKKHKLIERRQYSLIKPLLYLFLQIILIWEFFWILTGDARLDAWSYGELLLSAIMIVYFAMKSYKIYKRTLKPNKWDDMIKMDKFLHS